MSKIFIKVTKKPSWQVKKWFWCKQVGKGGGFTTAEACINREENPKNFISFEKCSSCDKVEYFRTLKTIEKSNSPKIWIKVKRDNVHRGTKRRIKCRRKIR